MKNCVVGHVQTVSNLANHDRRLGPEPYYIHVAVIDALTRLPVHLLMTPEEFQVANTRAERLQQPPKVVSMIWKAFTDAWNE